MTAISISQLSESITLATLAVLTDLRNSQSEALAGFGLYSDASAMSISPAANSKNNLLKSIESDQSDSEYYKWSPGEWDMESFGVTYFANINSQLQTVSATPDEASFLSFRHAFFSACVQVLLKIRNDGKFEGLLDCDSVLVFAATDYESHEEEKAWIRTLNAPESANKFSAWIDSL